MRKFKKTLVCRNCGKSFTVESGDAVMPATVELFCYPLCRKCRLKAQLAKCGK